MTQPRVAVPEKAPSQPHTDCSPESRVGRYGVALAFSKAIFQRSKAASSAEFCEDGFGSFDLISPISTFSASLSLFLGELRGWTFRTPVDGRSGLAGQCAPRARTPLTGRRSSFVGRAKQRAIVAPEHEQHRLAVQPVWRRFVGRAGGHSAGEEADVLQRPDRAAHTRLGQTEGGMVRQLAPVNRERSQEPVGYRPEPAK